MSLELSRISCLAATAYCRWSSGSLPKYGSYTRDWRRICRGSHGSKKIGSAICQSVSDRQQAAPEPKIENGKLYEEQNVALTKENPIQTLTFQEAIQRLQEYWSQAGCAVLQPSNTEVGAGTMNPATFLRVLGPEPWKVAYVEPSVRPDDSRYGENPNRVQQHTQFQVILKPDPGVAQELYLGSLSALGIDSNVHDIRFVEDNWESPVLGAWGLGWEVWLNGMEISQFTYFQQAGSIPVNPVSVEITYGLERIIMSLQGVDHFKKILYSPGVTYGELFLQNEMEMSAFNLDHADVARMKQMFELYDMEARSLIQKKLPIPAYAQVLKTSHAFNILDARGAIGVTERARFFAKMRNLARECAQLWVVSREALGFPLGSAKWADTKDAGAQTAPPSVTRYSPESRRMLVLEIGSEELPPDDVSSAVNQLLAGFPALLSQLRLPYSSVEASGTPRRIWVAVSDLAQSQEDSTLRVRGPPKAKAFDSAGNSTKALDGFCRKNSISAEQVTVGADEKGVEYVFADVLLRGRSSLEVLAEEVPKLIAQISFPRTMRWNSEVSYSRPMRWILCLHGGDVVPFSYGGLSSSRQTRLLRNSAVNQAAVPSAEQYSSVVSAGGIVLSVQERRDRIWSESSDLAHAIGGRIPEACRGALLEEVANLVECPAPLLGRFDERFLSLPREVLQTVMNKHQRYFPVEDAASGALLNAFVTVANGQSGDPAVVRQGNQAVLRARYEDARFFYESDISKPLESFRERLDGIIFQDSLGSLLARSGRIQSLVPAVFEAMYPSGQQSPLSGAVLAVAQEAAPLAMADLGTSLVAEFTNLAGTLGRHYALKEGRDAGVADAIFESCLPRFAGDELPKTPPGVILALAARLDSLVGLFAVKCEPTSSADPFGLRRTAYGLVETLVSSGCQVDLPSLFSAAAQVQPVDVSDQVLSQVLTFVVRRLEQLLIDSGKTVEVVRAVLAERGSNPALASASVSQMEEASEKGKLGGVVAAYARPTRIVRGKDIDRDWKVDSSKFEVEEERALWQAYLSVRQAVDASSDILKFVEASEALFVPLEAFFDNVFVMAEDQEVRRNRLALLRDVADLPRGIADLSLLPGF